MLLYHVSWIIDRDLAKGKGRPTSKEIHISFSVLCRNVADAVCCLQYEFSTNFPTTHGIALSDGEIKIKRSKIDSRGFDAKYLFMDGIRQPIFLHNLKSNVLRVNSIF